MTERKSPEPRFPGITPVLSGGRWKWRAVWRESGKQKRGPVREDPADAYEDYWAKVPKGRDASTPLNLSSALEAVLDEARANNLPDRTVGSYRTALEGIRALWKGDPDIRAFNVDSVRYAVREALRQGRSTTTVRNHYLMHLHQAFKLAGLPSPVPEARQRMRSQLKAKYMPPPVMTREEVEHHLMRIRSYPRIGRNPLLTQERDADLFELVAFTGIRHGELARARVADLDRAAMRLRVPNPKDRGNPRTIPLPGRLKPVLERLCTGKRTAHKIAPKESALNAIVHTWKSRLDEPRWNFRQLRHAYATGLLRAGATVVDVGKLLGHAPNSMSTMRYLHALDQGLEDAVTRYAEH